jgi:uncharacterized protein (TIGR00730 family)
MNICVFLGSSIGKDPFYAETAFELGKQIAIANHKLVYGGGGLGLMNELANGCLSAGGDVYGVITERLLDIEAGHKGIQELKIVQTMHERKKLMSDAADCFILLPGGVGSYEEIFEIMAWNQLQIIDKPIFILNTNGFYDSLKIFLEHAKDEGFFNEKTFNMLNLYDSIDEILSKID